MFFLSLVCFAPVEYFLDSDPWRKSERICVFFWIMEINILHEKSAGVKDSPEMSQAHWSVGMRRRNNTALI